MTPNDTPPEDRVPESQPPDFPPEHDAARQEPEPPLAASRLEVEALWAMRRTDPTPPPQQPNDADQHDIDPSDSNQ